MEWDGSVTLGCFIRKKTKGKYFFKNTLLNSALNVNVFNYVCCKIKDTLFHK